MVEPGIWIRAIALIISVLMLRFLNRLRIAYREIDRTGSSTVSTPQGVAGSLLRRLLPLMLLGGLVSAVANAVVLGALVLRQVGVIP
jgi:hypothetical protein